MHELTLIRSCLPKMNLDDYSRNEAEQRILKHHKESCERLKRKTERMVEADDAARRTEARSRNSHINVLQNRTDTLSLTQQGTSHKMLWQPTASQELMKASEKGQSMWSSEHIHKD